jgi:hypothetical protein
MEVICLLAYDFSKAPLSIAQKFITSCGAEGIAFSLPPARVILAPASLPTG